MRVRHRAAALCASLATLVIGNAASAQQPSAPPLDATPAPPTISPPPSPAPQESAAPAGEEGDARARAEALEHAHVGSRSPEHVWLMASAYASLAESGRDPWDARLALLYIERYLATTGTKPTPEQHRTMRRLEALAAQTKRIRRGAGGTDVSFLAYQGEDEFTVEVSGHRCRTPCTLALPAGPQKLMASGDGDVEADIVVPPFPSMVRLQGDASGMVVAGGILIPVGIVVGASLWALAFTCTNSDSCVLANLISWPLAGATMLVTGIVLVAIAPDPPADANRIEIVGAVRPRFSPPVPGVRMQF